MQMLDEILETASTEIAQREDAAVRAALCRALGVASIDDAALESLRGRLGMSRPQRGVRHYWLDGVVFLTLDGPHIESEEDARNMRITTRIIQRPRTPQA